MRVAVVAHLDEPARDLLRADLTEAELLWCRDDGGPAWSDDVATCDVVFGGVPRAWLERMPQLRWVQLESVGFDGYLPAADLLAERGVVLTNVHGQFSHSVTETGIAGLLALLRGIAQLLEGQAQRRWVPDLRPQLGLLAGRRAVVLGDGSIGRQTRRVLEAFDCEVVSYARTSPGAELHDLPSLETALATADVVVAALPAHPTTDDLLDRRRLDLLPAGAVIVSVGRGGVLDEDALLEGLESGRLGGAVLEVTRAEPLPADSPLWTAPRTVLTQHSGGGYVDELTDKARRFLANLARYRAGEPLEHVVDLHRG